MFLVNQRRSFAMNVHGFQRTLFSPSPSPLFTVQPPSPMYNTTIQFSNYSKPHKSLFCMIYFLQGSSFLVRFAWASEESELDDSVFGTPIAMWERPCLELPWRWEQDKCFAFSSSGSDYNCQICMCYFMAFSCGVSCSWILLSWYVKILSFLGFFVASYFHVSIFMYMQLIVWLLCVYVLKCSGKLRLNHPW